MEPIYLTVPSVVSFGRRVASTNSDNTFGPSQGFGDSGRRAIYFQGFREKGHLFSGIWGDFGVLGSREQWAEEKYFRELRRKVIFLSGSREQRPPPPGEASV